MIAMDIAKKGYPVLVLRQAAESVRSRQIRDFLAAISDQRQQTEIARGHEPPAEVPALIVLDSQHVGGHFEDLCLELRRARRRAVLLRAVAFDEAEAMERIEKADIMRKHEVLKREVEKLADYALFVRPGDLVLPPLRASLTGSEISDLAGHSSMLQRRGLKISAHDERTWRDFQKGQAYVPSRIARSHPGTVHNVDFFKAEDHFWAGLYHFLRNGELDVFRAAIDRRLERVRHESGCDAPECEAVLGEIAKASVAGLALPFEVLRDWFGSQGLATIGSIRAEAPPAEDVGDSRPNQEEIRKYFTNHAMSRFSTFSNAARPEERLRSHVRRLESAGFVRTGLVGDRVFVRFFHRQVARTFLVNVLGMDSSKLARESQFELLQGILPALKSSRAGIEFCQQVSEQLLLPDDDWFGWNDGRGESRLQTYQTIPRELVERSRVLLHHHALALRKSAFWKGLSNATRMDRLSQAQQLCEKALKMPWSIGERDEHPDHIQTTLGLVRRDLSKVDPENKQAHRRAAVKHLEQAVENLPESRPTRLALARLLVQEARTTKNGEPDLAARAAARALWLLSIEPDGRYAEAWHGLRKDASDVFGDDRGTALVDKLIQEQNEAGYLLRAEMLVAAAQDVTGAVALLKRIVAGSDAGRNWNAARRLAALMLIDRDQSVETKSERRRLLLAVENKAKLTPAEDFHLACLAFQLRCYADGEQRFRHLRLNNRHLLLTQAAEPFLSDDHGVTAEFKAVVERVYELGARGQMGVHLGHARQFTASFYPRHFFAEGAVTPGKTTKVHVRLSPWGPQAVPVRPRGRS